LGDVSLMLNYYVYNDRLNSDFSPHHWLINAGIKMPTGNFDTKNATAINPSFQLGTGSWDWLTGLNYQYIIQKFALQYSADYIIKQKNERAYKFGNQFNQSLMGYYFTDFKSLKIQPKMGVQAEHYANNQQMGDSLPKTSGFMILGKTGLEISHQQWLLGAEISLPIYDNLAEGQIKAISRLAVLLNYSF
jgi:hypothetical protein